MTADQLYPVFKGRMNTKFPLPPQFLEARRILNSIPAQNLPNGLLDPEDADLLDAPFTLDDMEESKEHPYPRWRKSYGTRRCIISANN